MKSKDPKQANHSFAAKVSVLISSDDWQRIDRHSKAAAAFNLFALIEDAVCENAWSRIIQFLFDSSGRHGLGKDPLDSWCKAALEKVPRWVSSAAASTSETEWGTFEKRRLDILVKMLDQEGRLLGVLGIENKVWSGEQVEQLSHYQEALCREFPHVPKLLVFLTPDCRDATTAGQSSKCPVRCVSYVSLRTMCNSLYGRTGGTVRLLISSLRQYLNENMISKPIKDEKIRRSVARLYQNADHRRVIEQIIVYRPTVKSVLEQVASSIQDAFSAGRFGKANTCTHDYWPANDDYTPELRLWVHGPTSPSGTSMCYMLRSKPRGPKPFIGDKFTVLLSAWCENDIGRRKIQKITSQLPPRQRHTWKRWQCWEVLWEGESHELRDLDKRDIARLTTNLLAALEVTFKPLCTALKSIQAK